MTNAGKYKDAIMAQMCKTGRWGVNQANEIIGCDVDVCFDCIFKEGDYCYERRKEWLNAEAKKAFSEKDKEVLRLLDKVQWVVRDEKGILWGSHKKPYKMGGVWCCAGNYINLTTLTTAEFAPVTMEDDEPTSREEILGDEK